MNRSIMLRAIARASGEELQRLHRSILEDGVQRSDQQVREAWRQWRPRETDIALYTMYADSDDTAIPLAMNAIEDKETGERECIPFQVTHAAFNVASLFVPISVVAHGHKHLCVCRFPSGIPDILDRLLPLHQWDPADSHELLLSNLK